MLVSCSFNGVGGFGRSFSEEIDPHSTTPPIPPRLIGGRGISEVLMNTTVGKGGLKSLHLLTGEFGLVGVVNE